MKKLKRNSFYYDYLISVGTMVTVADVRYITYVTHLVRENSVGSVYTIRH